MKQTEDGKYIKVVADEDMVLTEWTPKQPLETLWICNEIYVEKDYDFSKLREIPEKQGIELKEMVNGK